MILNLVKKFTNFLRVLFINIFIFILGIIIIELIFGTWLKKNNYSSLLIPRQQTNIIDNFPYKHETLGIYSRDKHGFRANQYDLNLVDILILGGSTTEERDVDDNKIWTKVFEKNLENKLKVINAGIGGQTSYGHKSMFNMWFKNFTDLKPKFIIVYLGINDALYLVEYMNNQEMIFNGRQINSSNRDTLINLNYIDRVTQYFKNNSIFHSIYLILKGNIISNKYKVGYNSTPTSFIAYEEQKPKFLINLEEKLLITFKEYYQKNLLHILKESQVYDAELILVTQTLSNKYWLKSYLETINNFTLDFCKINKLTCFNAESDTLKLKESYFYDGIHTTPEGSRVIGKFIAKKFNDYYF